MTLGVYVANGSWSSYSHVEPEPFETWEQSDEDDCEPALDCIHCCNPSRVPSEGSGISMVSSEESESTIAGADCGV